ncbi:MAG: hypothetical protein WBV22_11905 [Anaerolineaceae bacterium]
MTIRRRIVLLLFIAWLLLSCNLLTNPTNQTPAIQEPAINVETSVAGTHAFDAAVQTAAAGQIPPTSQVVPATSQPPAPPVEPTSGAAMINATIDTNCRTGPSTVYEAISFLLVGKTSEVVNKYQNGLWWVIKDPNNPNLRCWVWGQTTTVTGAWQQLPEATVPPTPTIKLSLEVTITFIAPPAFVGPCPIPVTGAGTITTNMPVTVTYIWERSAGPNLGSGSLIFAAAGTQNVTFATNFFSTSGGTIRIHVTSPMDVTSDWLPYNVVCMP